MGEELIRVLHPNHYTGHRIEHEEYKTRSQIKEELQRKRLWKSLNLLGLLLFIVITIGSEVLPYWIDQLFTFFRLY